MKDGVKIQIPPQPLSIIETLNKNGFEAYAVGGCVRDSLLGQTPDDWDIATSARPEEVKSLFEKTVDTGIRHGTVTVILSGKGYEVTTFRAEGRYLDFRRPEKVEFITALEEDLCRRDFTVNAMACHPVLGLIDPFGGREDLKKRLIRAVGCARTRFEEDALRMLRAARFSAQLGFQLEAQTYEALKSCRSLIANISGERIRDEMTRLLVSPHPEKLALLCHSGVLGHIMPEFGPCDFDNCNSPESAKSPACHTLRALTLAEPDRLVRWTVLLAGLGFLRTSAGAVKGDGAVRVEAAFHVLSHLRFDSKTARLIQKVLENWDEEITPSGSWVRKAASRMGIEALDLLLKAKEAMARSRCGKRPDETADRLIKAGEILKETIERQHCLTLRSMAVNGNDLASLGFKRGEEMGQILRRLLDMVLENPKLNERDTLLSLAKQMLSSREKHGHTPESL